MTSFKNRKSSQQNLVKFFRYFFPFLKHKQINLKCSKTLCNFFPFLNDFIKNLDNIGFVFAAILQADKLLNYCIILGLKPMSIYEHNFSAAHRLLWRSCQALFLVMSLKKYNQIINLSNYKKQ